MRHPAMITAMLTLAVWDGAASAFSHVPHLAGNLREATVCADPGARACQAAETAAPSRFHNLGKTSFQISDDGSVKLRLDAVRIDAGVTFSCERPSALCVGGFCDGGPFDDTACVVDAHCQPFSCVGGPQNGKLCSTQADCQSLDGSEGWTVVFGGMNPVFLYAPECDMGHGLPPAPGYCVPGIGVVSRECPFSLARDGSPAVGKVNANGLAGCATANRFGPQPPQPGGFLAPNESPALIEFVRVIDPEGNLFLGTTNR